MEISLKICQLRKMAGLTQEQMADKIDVSRQTISKWESGTSVPDWHSMVKISKLFNIPLDDFASTDSPGHTSENSPKITLDDLIELASYNRKRQLLLVFAVAFFMISLISIIVAITINSSILSIQYMLYRYIALEEYSFIPADYFYSYFFAMISGAAGVFLCVLYALLSKHKKFSKH